MNEEVSNALTDIFNTQKKFLDNDWEIENNTLQKEQKLQQIISEKTNALSELCKKRVRSEIEKLGPLEGLLADPTITEILVNSPESIFVERYGRLEKHSDRFFDESTYNQCIERISQLCHSYMNKEKPFIETQIGKFRYTLIFSDLSRGHHLLSIRKQPEQLWTLEKLYQSNWCSESQYRLLQKLISEQKNFLMIGGTSSGKTSALQAMINEMPQNERLVIIEDTQELHLCNPMSVSLLTRTDGINKNNDVTMNDLLKRALRLRPDRLVVGEIRGAEAMNLLMALATGHAGSFGSMHARTASEALLRLEMLIQMGAPQWSLQSIRRLIGMTVEYILVVEKKNGQRSLEGIYKITSVEETGITMMKLDGV
jgi:pilus assembly protein CpaF